MKNRIIEVHPIDKETLIEITIYEEPQPLKGLSDKSFCSQYIVFEKGTENIIEAFFREKKITESETKQLINEYKEIIDSKKEECRKTGFYQGNKKTFQGL